MIDNPDGVIGSSPHCLDLNCYYDPSPLVQPKLQHFASSVQGLFDPCRGMRGGSKIYNLNAY